MYTQDELMDIIIHNIEYFNQMEHTEEICLMIVNVNGLFLRVLNKQNHKICFQAITNNPKCFYCVKNKTYDLCKLAVSLEGNLIDLVPLDIENRYELEKIAVKQDGLSIGLIDKQTLELKMLALKQNGMALQFIDKQSPDLCRIAVEEYGMALQFVKEKTSALCLKAVQNCGDALEFVDKQTKQIINTALKVHGCAIKFIHRPLTEMYILAVKSCGLSLQFITKQTPEICQLAIKQNPDAIQFVLLQYTFSYLSCKAPDDHCPICLEDDNNGWCKLGGCSHKFHLECIKHVQNESTNKKCPLCRTPFTLKFIV